MRKAKYSFRGIGRIGAAALAMAAYLAGPVAAIAADAPAAHPASSAPASGTASPPPAGAAVAVPVDPVQAFAKLPFVERANISPDGERIAGMFNVNGQQQVRVLSLFDKAEGATGFQVPDGTQIEWLRWVGNDYVLAGLTALNYVDAGQRWYISRLVSLDRKTGKVSRIMWDMEGQDASSVLWGPRDNSHEVLVAAQNSIYLGEEFWPAVYRVDLATGRKTKIVRGRDDVMDWFSDAAGRIRAGVSYSDSVMKARLIYHGEAESNFRTIDRANLHQRERLFIPIVFLPGTDHALVEHNDEQGRDGIFEMDLVKMQDIKPIYVAPAGVEIGYPITTADGNGIAGVTTSAPDRPVVWLDPAFAELQADLDKAVPGRRAQIVSFSQDRQRMVVWISRPDSPGAYYYFDQADGRMQFLSFVNDQLKMRPLGPVKLIDYAARDGTKIEGVLTLPADRPAKNLPLIMLPHGGPWAQDTADYDYWPQFLASRGYAVLQPNFRGSTGYGEEFMRKGEGQLGLAMQDDVTDGFKWAVSQGIADPARTCIVGASYGGYAAMWGLAKDPGLYRCGISIAGVASLRREVNDFGHFLQGRKFMEDWTRMTPDFAAVSPVNSIDRIKAPLLLIHGKKDVTVDVGQSRSMFAKMKAAGKDVQYVELPLADHHFGREGDRVTLLREIDTFLQKNNPPDPAPKP